MPQSVTDFDVFRTGQKEYLTIFAKDPSTDMLVDVYGNSTFTLTDIASDETIVSKSFTAAGGDSIEHSATGVYQYEFDAAAYPGEYLAAFRCVLQGEVINQNIFIKSEPAVLFARAAALRVQIDKARKSTNDSIENMDTVSNEPSVRLFYGYDDKHLIYYLERGIQFINAVPPYTAMSPISFPWNQYGMVATDAAVIAALESQGIFAIDTDYNYSLGGNSLVIDHFGKISQYLSTLTTRFDSYLMKFKQQYRSKGIVMFQWMPGGVRAARQLSAMPSGFWSRMLSTSFV